MGAMATTFTRMDESTAEQWRVIGSETTRNQPRVAEQFLTMLRQLEAITDGFATNQMVHCLQTATLAEKAGADDEIVFASLCHDIGKVVSVFNHPAIAAEMIRPFVRDEVYHMIRTHQDFQGRHYYAHFGGDPDARERYEGEPWFDLTARFADEWDQIAFDPDAETYRYRSPATSKVGVVRAHRPPSPVMMSPGLVMVMSVPSSVRST
jgi:predicted HD phosphohydrolase